MRVFPSMGLALNDSVIRGFVYSMDVTTESKVSAEVNRLGDYELLLVNSRNVIITSKLLMTSGEVLTETANEFPMNKDAIPFEESELFASYGEAKQRKMLTVLQKLNKRNSEYTTLNAKINNASTSWDDEDEDENPAMVELKSRRDSAEEDVKNTVSRFANINTDSSQNTFTIPEAYAAGIMTAELETFYLEIIKSDVEYYAMSDTEIGTVEEEDLEHTEEPEEDLTSEEDTPADVPEEAEDAEMEDNDGFDDDEVEAVPTVKTVTL